MNHLIQHLSIRPMPTIGASTGVSISGAAVSLGAAVQVVQLIAGLVAIVSGCIGIAVGLWHLKEIWKKARGK